MPVVCGPGLALKGNCSLGGKVVLVLPYGCGVCPDYTRIDAAGASVCREGLAFYKTLGGAADFRMAGGNLFNLFPLCIDQKHNGGKAKE